MRTELLLRLGTILLVVSVAATELMCIAPLVIPEGPEGIVCGIVFFDANKNGVFDQGFEWTLSDVAVQLVDEFGLDTVFTNEMGSYVFPSVTGDYQVSLPILYSPYEWTITTPTVQLMETIDYEGEVTSGPAFGIWTPVPLEPPSPYMVMAPIGHTHGFWMTNIGKLLGIIGGRASVDEETIKGYLETISLNFGGATDDGFLNDLDLGKAYAILSVPDSANMRYKAQCQILSLLMSNLYWGHNGDDVYLPDVGQGDDFVGKIEGATEYILELYNNKEYAAAQSLAAALNNMSSYGVNTAAPI